MSPFQRHRWFVAAAGITLAYVAVSLLAHPGSGLTAFADIAGFALLLCGTAVSLANAFRRPPQERSFWCLMAAGFLLWACNQASWVYFELILKHLAPDPDLFDIVLFFHVVPMIAAAAWRADLLRKEKRIHSGVLNFIMLFGWWSFLYAFVVFPHQYIVLNPDAYDVCYDRLYMVENGLLIAVLAIAAWTSFAGWRRLYLHLLGARLVYAVGSLILNHALNVKTYYSGSLYDIAWVAPIAWIIAVMLSAPDWNLQIIELAHDSRWNKLVPNLAMMAIISLPVLGVWTVLFDRSSPAARAFRILSVLAAMLLLGAFVFLRQYFQDQALISLLNESRRAYDRQKDLQSQLVQKEKLASLGNFVSGAAHEINHPLSAIMTSSEHLWSIERLTPDQDALIRKITNQAHRTRELVANLLSFAQQAPGQKIPVDLCVLLHRAVQMLEPKRIPGKIQLRLSIAQDIPTVWANAKRLFQAFVELIENAMDAMEENGGGLLEISAQLRGEEILIRFSDTGPGIKDPLRVFDPFYTTKAVGKGTGLGLSAVYGVVQEHDGQITCQNKPQGGAVFILLLPMSTEPTAKAATAAF